MYSITCVYIYIYIHKGSQNNVRIPAREIPHACPRLRCCRSCRRPLVGEHIVSETIVYEIIVGECIVRQLMLFF